MPSSDPLAGIPILRRIKIMIRKPLFSVAVCFVLGALLLSFSGSGSAADSSKEAKINRAMSAGPPSVSAKAKIVEMDDKGKMNVLRDGNNGWTCFTGHQGVIGDNPECDEEAALQWAMDLAAHKPKPSNTKPGVVYMFAGGMDWSATDPLATRGTPIQEPPHWMIMWPFEPKASGLPDRVKSTGTWIMWAGTPYAHLMINQKP
jgi:hypothetical protein